MLLIAHSASTVRACNPQMGPEGFQALFLLRPAYAVEDSVSSASNAFLAHARHGSPSLVHEPRLQRNPVSHLRLLVRDGRPTSRFTGTLGRTLLCVRSSHEARPTLPSAAVRSGGPELHPPRVTDAATVRNMIV